MRARGTRRAALLAALALAALLAGCTAPEPAPAPASTPRPGLQEPEDGPVAPSSRPPGRGPFVDAEGKDLWAVRSEGCACLDPHTVVAYYRDGGVLVATYTVEGKHVQTTNATQAYGPALESLFAIANPWGSRDEAAAAGQGERGVLVHRVWTGTLPQHDLDAVGTYLTRAVREAQDAAPAPYLDCLCRGIRVETFGGFQGRADSGPEQDLDARWAAVAEQMALLDAWLR